MWELPLKYSSCGLVASRFLSVLFCRWQYIGNMFNDPPDHYLLGCAAFVGSSNLHACPFMSSAFLNAVTGTSTKRSPERPPSHYPVFTGVPSLSCILLPSLPDCFWSRSRLPQLIPLFDNSKLAAPALKAGSCRSCPHKTFAFNYQCSLLLRENVLYS